MNTGRDLSYEGLGARSQGIDGEGNSMKQTLRILHLEDDLRDAKLVEEMLLSEGIACDIVRVDTKTAFIGALEQSGFEMIFAD